MVRRIIRIFALFLAGLVILTAGLYFYLRNADLSRYQGFVEAFVSDSIGHELSIDGRFELQFGSTTTLVAEEISLNSSEWPGETRLIRVGYLEVAFHTWSIFGRPFLVEQLTAIDIEGLVARSEEGRINWATNRPRRKDPGAAPLDLNMIAFRNVSIETVDLVYEDPVRSRPINLQLERLTVSPDKNDILDLDLRGVLNELPLWADGKLGPWQNFVDGRNIFADLDLSLGPVGLAIDGKVADVLSLEGVELSGVLSGPDISQVLERLLLPPFSEGQFEVVANLQQMESGHQVRIDGNLGQIELFASGSIDNLLLPSSVGYDFSIRGPNARHVAELFGIDGVPSEPFQVSGDYSREAKLLGFDDALLRVGNNAVRFEGRVDIDAGNLDIVLSAEGPDFSIVGPFAGVPGLPQVPFTVAGHLAKNGAIWEAENIQARVGENGLTANGRLEAGSANAAEIALKASGPDISIIEDIIGVKGIPARPYDIDVVLRSHPSGIEIAEGKASFADTHVEARGVLVPGSGFSGSSGTVRVWGSELDNVALVTGVPYLPSGPFEVEGDLELQTDQLILANTAATVAGMEGSANGVVVIQGENLGDFDLDVVLEGVDAAALPELDWLESFAGDPFELEGGLALAGEELSLSEFDVRIANLGATLNGRIVGPATYVEVSVNASGADATVLGKAAKLANVPAGAVAMDGSFTKSEDDLEFSDAHLAIGDYSVFANGKLSLQPLSNDSDLEFSFSGPSLLEVGGLYGFTGLPDKQFELSGQFHGTPTGFQMDNFAAQLGENNVYGEFDVNLEGKPHIVGYVSSTHLDVTEQLALGEPASEGESAEAASGDKRLFSDEPLDTSWLQKADIDLNIRVDRFVARAMQVTNVDIGIDLRDGALFVDPFYLREDSGSIEGSFSLVPNDGIYTMSSWVEVDDVHVGLVSGENQDASTLPLLSGTVHLEGKGESVRQIMASSNGEAALRTGAGRVREVFGSGFFGDIFVQAFRAMNPRRERGYREVECGFYDATIENGVVNIERLAVQTDRITVVASGRIRLNSERIDITFRAKPREGIGVSLGTVANSFIAIGGTLSEPSISLDPTRSAATTGAAVATGGLSLLARGLWDRLSAEASICDERRR